MSTPLELPVVHRLETLPYWPVYAEWTFHLTGCARCFAVMDEASGGCGLTEALCPVGQPLATAVNYQVAVQAALAALN